MPLKSAKRSGMTSPASWRLSRVRRSRSSINNLGMDLLLDVERRRLDDEVAPVLLILAAPDELRVEIAVAPLVGDAPRLFRLLLDDGLVLRGRDVLSGGFLTAVTQGID